MNLMNTWNITTNRIYVYIFFFFNNTGVHFETDSLVNEIATAIKVFAYGVESYTLDPRNANESLTTQLSCQGAGESRWKKGDRFYR